MILSETLKTLGEADLNQRYKHTWIEYDGQMIMCVGFPLPGVMTYTIPVDPKLPKKKVDKIKDVYAENPYVRGRHEEDRDDEVDVMVDELQEFDPPIPPVPQPALPRHRHRHGVQEIAGAERRVAAAHAHGLNAIVNDVRIINEWREDREIINQQLGAIRHMEQMAIAFGRGGGGGAPIRHQELRVRFNDGDEGVGHDKPIEVVFDYRKLNVARLPVRWYQAGAEAAYISYTNQRQYQRGYCGRNTFILRKPSTKLDQWDWYQILNGMLKERDKKVPLMALDEFKAQLQKRQPFLISNCMALTPHGTWDKNNYDNGHYIMYRRHAIAEVDSSDTGKIKLLNPAFKQELQEKVKGIERLIVT